MAKKAIKKEKAPTVSEDETTTLNVGTAIQPVHTDFGREDLNALRDKVNELIARG